MTQEQISVFQKLVDQTKQQLDAYQAVLDLATAGYQSDKTAIDQAVSDKVTATLAPVHEAQLALADALSNVLTTATPAIPAEPVVTP